MFVLPSLRLSTTVPLPCPRMEKSPPGRIPCPPPFLSALLVMDHVPVCRRFPLARPTSSRIVFFRSKEVYFLLVIYSHYIVTLEHFSAVPECCLILENDRTAHDVMPWEERVYLILILSYCRGCQGRLAKTHRLSAHRGSGRLIPPIGVVRQSLFAARSLQDGEGEQDGGEHRVGCSFLRDVQVEVLGDRPRCPEELQAVVSRRVAVVRCDNGTLAVGVDQLKKGCNQFASHGGCTR